MARTQPDRRSFVVRGAAVLGEGIAAFKPVCDLDLEGIVAKRLDDPYGTRAKWWKILNRSYSQKVGRAELFERPAPNRKLVKLNRPTANLP